MCLDCLKKNVDECSEVIDDLKEQLDKIECECCKQVPKAFINIACSIKLYGLIKVRKYETKTENEKKILNDIEMKTKQKIVTLLNNMIESIDNQKDDMPDGAYLRLMNNVNELNKYYQGFGDIESNM